MEAIYNESGQVQARYVYDAWGKVASILDANNNQITDTNHIGHINPIRYRGYYYDTETSFYYLQSRYYDSEVGRFISADGQISDIGGDVLGYNLYTYCMNNPVNNIDTNGNFPISLATFGAVMLFSYFTAAIMGVTALAVTTGNAYSSSKIIVNKIEDEGERMQKH